MREEAESEKHGDGGIDADKEVTHLPEDDGGVDVFERGVMPVEAVGEPEGDWDEESDKVGDCDPFVFAADREGVAGNTPGDG